MCDPEKCPLSEICEQRVAIAEHVSDEQHASIETRHEGAITRLDANTDDAANLTEAITYAREASAYLGESAAAFVLDCDIVVERLDQIRDALYCKGVIKQRKYGFFGPVVARMCGSESRTERLAGHTERLEPHEAYTLISETEEI